MLFRGKPPLQESAKESCGESTGIYRTIVEKSGGMMWVLDAKGRFLFFNRRTREVIGRKIEDWKGKPFAPLVVKEDLPKALGAFKKAMSGTVQKCEVSVKRRGGGIFTLSVTYVPFRSGGRIIGSLGFGEDITVKKKSEEELKKAKDMLENIAHGITDSVYLISRDCRILWANASAAKITGRKISELVGMHCYEATHKRASPCTLPQDACPMGEVLKTGKPASAVHRHYDKKGVAHSVEIVVYPVKDENGNIIQFVHTSKDITGRQKMHDDLIKFKLGLERSNDAAFITETDGTITYVNPAFERIYGYSRDEALGKTPRILKSGLLPKKAYKEFWDTLLAKKVVSGEIVNKSKDGRLLTMEGSVNPILDKNESLIGFLSIQHDITKRKELGEQMKKLNEELKSKVEALERFNKLAVGRELKMIELKARIRELEGSSAK